MNSCSAKKAKKLLISETFAIFASKRQRYEDKVFTFYGFQSFG